MKFMDDTQKFIRKIKKYDITKQQQKTLRGQVLNGDLVGAEKGLTKLFEVMNE